GRAGGLGGMAGGMGGFGGGRLLSRGGAPMPQMAERELLEERAANLGVVAQAVDNAALPPGAVAKSAAAAPEVKPVRVREYFPETLYSNPSLVTDAEGKAKIDLRMADSITTWRITALASSR